jgi:REP element-mobilizing transposase RayT
VDFGRVAANHKQECLCYYPNWRLLRMRQSAIIAGMTRPPVTTKKLNISKRNLPHWEFGGSWYLITFRTKELNLSPEARDMAINAIARGDSAKFDLAIGVVMPDHVHLLLLPCKKGGDNYFSLKEILGPLKGFSAKQINKILNRSGAFWQYESFDRIIRDEKEWLEKYNGSSAN